MSIAHSYILCFTILQIVNFTLPTFYDDCSKQITSDYTVIVRKDESGKTSTLFLFKEDVILDSLMFVASDFIVDTLRILNDSIWTYNRSLGFAEYHGVYTEQELLITVVKEQLHVCYVGTFKYLNVRDEDQTFGYFWEAGDQINLQGINGAYVEHMDSTIKIVEYRHKGKKKLDEKISVVTSQVDLSYDSMNDVFFTSIDTLDGFYNMLEKEPNNGDISEVESQERVIFDKRVYSIDTGSYQYLFFDGMWYKGRKLPNILVLSPLYHR